MRTLHRAQALKTIPHAEHGYQPGVVTLETELYFREMTRYTSPVSRYCSQTFRVNNEQLSSLPANTTYQSCIPSKARLEINSRSRLCFGPILTQMLNWLRMDGDQ